MTPAERLVQIESIRTKWSGNAGYAATLDIDIAALRLLVADTPQPIETAPKDGTRVLVFVPGPNDPADPNFYQGWHVARFEPELKRAAYTILNGTYLPALDGIWVAGGEMWSDETLAFEYDQPTHWKPVPEDPR